MAAEWFFLADGKTKIGPVTASQMQDLAAIGRLRAGDLVWKPGMAEWVAASKVKGLLLRTAAAAVQATPPPQAKATPGQDQPGREKRDVLPSISLPWYQTKGFLLTAAISIAFVFVVGAVALVTLAVSARDRPQLAPVAQNTPKEAAPSEKQSGLPVNSPPSNPANQPAVPVTPQPMNQAPMLPVIPEGQNNAGGPLLAESVARVAEFAARTKAVAGYGYNDGISILAAWVGRGGSVDFGYDLIAGLDYVFVAAGDNAVKGLQLEIFDFLSGQRVAIDPTIQPLAMTPFRPQFSRKYLLKMSLITSTFDLPCICSLVVLRQNGGVAPFQNIDSATFKLEEIVATLNRNLGPKTGKRYDFRFAQNQWAVYGGVLSQGSELGVVNMDLGSGERIFVGVSDGHSKRLDLSLANQFGQIIGVPQGTLQMPFLAAPVNGRGYSMRVRNSSSRDASVVMMAVLDTF